MANLVVYKDTGEILFDTNLISYGLIKSGYMSLQQYWSRRQKRSAQLDPNDGANWWPVVVYGAGDALPKGSRCDQLWGFTVFNAISPICFITGPGCAAGSTVSGSAMTFFYANATADTKFYCFDLMADNLAGTTFLKTYDTTGRITFNSLQPPLNVVATATPPAPPTANNPYGRKLQPYNGGRVSKRQYISANGSLASQMDAIFDISYVAGVEYAVYLPWSRSAGIIETDPSSGFTGPATQYSVAEGAYGRVGGISFIFGAAAGTNEAYPGGFNSAPASYDNIPTDRFPVALVIKTENLIFPFN